MADILHFLRENEAVISLLVLAFVVTMREELPPPFNRVSLFNWLYGWIHDALKAFVSFRAPQRPDSK